MNCAACRRGGAVRLGRDPALTAAATARVQRKSQEQGTGRPHVRARRPDGARDHSRPRHPRRKGVPPCYLASTCDRSLRHDHRRPAPTDERLAPVQGCPERRLNTAGWRTRMRRSQGRRGGVPVLWLFWGTLAGRLARRPTKPQVTEAGNGHLSQSSARYRGHRNVSSRDFSTSWLSSRSPTGRIGAGRTGPGGWCSPTRRGRVLHRTECCWAGRKAVDGRGNPGDDHRSQQRGQGARC